MFNDLTAAGGPYHGRWWASDNPDQVVGGRLEHGGNFWTLTLFGWLGTWTQRNDTSGFPTVIHGEVGTTKITVLEPAPHGWRSQTSEPPYEVSVTAGIVISGVHADADVNFTSASVRLLHLNEWANRPPWRYSFNDSGDVIEETVSFVSPPALTARVLHADARLVRSWGQRGSELSSVTMASDEWVRFDFDEPMSLDMVEQEYVRPLRNLIELAAGEPSATLDLQLTPTGSDDDSPQVCALSLIAVDPSEPRHSFMMIFSADALDFDTLMSSWWRIHEHFGIVCDLLGALRRDHGYVGSHFLTAASAIEGYHRRRNGSVKQTKEHRARLNGIIDAAPDDDRAWLKAQLAFSHEPSFSARIDDVVGWAGPEFADAVGNVAAWRTWVKNARNSVAHRTTDTIDVDQDWPVTVRVTATIEWMLTLVLLRDLGLRDATIESGVKRHGGLRFARQYLKAVQPSWYDAET